MSVMADSNKVEGETPSEQNKILAEELLKRGFYVNKISRGATVDYLVVTTAPPQQKEPIV